MYLSVCVQQLFFPNVHIWTLKKTTSHLKVMDYLMKYVLETKWINEYSM